MKAVESVQCSVRNTESSSYKLSQVNSYSGQSRKHRRDYSCTSQRHLSVYQTVSQERSQDHDDKDHNTDASWEYTWATV